MLLGSGYWWKITAAPAAQVLIVLLVVVLQTVQRMFCVKFAAGSTILQQNAQPLATDCMYYLQEGKAEVVIMGTVDAASKQSECRLHSVFPAVASTAGCW